MSYTGQAITEIQEDRRDVHPVSLSSQRVEKQPPICCIASYYTIQCICVGEEAFLPLPGCSSQQALSACT